MLPGERFKNWIDGLAEAWKDRLRGWMMSWVEGGLLRLMDFIEPEAIDAMLPTLTRIAEHPATPKDIKDLIGKLVVPGKPIPLLVIIPLAVILFIPMLFSVAQPLATLLTYAEERVLHTYRVDPLSAITAWRRDPKEYEWLIDDLRDHGWSETRIEALKFYTLFYPAPADLVHWQAREVFEPDMIEKYGLDSELGEIKREPFYKAGMTDEQIVNYWRAHWEHASWMQIVEMLHRGLVTEEEVWSWFRLVEIPPFWRQPLIDTAYTWPTRVDVRRWWDMRTIDEVRLRELYSGMGYRGKNLDDYVLWTKVYVAFPDLIARWSKGWITVDVVRTELTELGMPAERVEEFIQMKVKPQEPERVDEGKALTKTEIYKGVKKDVITWEQGIELLMDLGYDYDEADYILTINVETLTGSPETFEAFKDITTKYKIATGREEKPMPEELKKASEEVVRLTGEIEALERSIEAEERGLIKDEEIPPAAAARLKELQVARNRAISELERVKSEYDRLVAEWRHGLP